MSVSASIIQPDIIESLLNNSSHPSEESVSAILTKSRDLKRLSLEEVATLIRVQDPALIQKIFDTADAVKNAIYGNRIVFFAPLYISNYCKNDCQYCAFKSSNKIVRHALTHDELVSETEILLKQGHKRILMVAGESYPNADGLDYILNAIDTIYSVRVGHFNIRRINVNIAPLETDDFIKLKAHQIGTFQLFQETYHEPTYKVVHPSGPKSDYNYRVTAMDRAIAAGIDDVGVGVLYGLYDWRFETLALLQHIAHLEKKFGLGPHTISVPRLEPATGVSLSTEFPYLVSDADFKKIIAILRLAVPYTGIILSTRENPAMRRDGLHMGVSQISAGSRTNPGGYLADQTLQHSEEQFSLGDHRPLNEVISDLLDMGFLPSFCTACYRLGRTGLDFMEYAKPGDIRKKCEPNALITFTEYLKDFGDAKTREKGIQFINARIDSIVEPKIKAFVKKSLQELDEGKRDIFI